MGSRGAYDAVVVGSGPNGLAAAISIALAGRSVAVFEARDTVGGGMRSGELTLPGFIHDICSTAHPLGVASPFFRTLPLDAHGLRWITPPLMLAHPWDVTSAEIAKALILCLGFVVHDGAQEGIVLHHGVVDLTAKEIDPGLHRCTHCEVDAP